MSFSSPYGYSYGNQHHHAPQQYYHHYQPQSTTSEQGPADRDKNCTQEAELPFATAAASAPIASREAKPRRRGHSSPLLTWCCCVCCCLTVAAVVGVGAAVAIALLTFKVPTANVKGISVPPDVGAADAVRVSKDNVLSATLLATVEITNRNFFPISLSSVRIEGYAPPSFVPGAKADDADSRVFATEKSDLRLGKDEATTVVFPVRIETPLSARTPAAGYAGEVFRACYASSATDIPLLLKVSVAPQLLFVRAPSFSTTVSPTYKCPYQLNSLAPNVQSLIRQFVAAFAPPSPAAS